MRNRRTEMVAKHEGFSPTTYRCTAGKLSIGYGFNLEAGITEEESRLLLEYRLGMIDDHLAYTLPFYSRLSRARQAVLCDMTYNLGITGLLKFEKMLKALEDENYHRAAIEMLDSKWARQVKGRARELASIMREGTYG